ncbi:Cellulose 1,4-beta-cellobiosidase (non-reducing end) [Scedosporium apiospermum]|uniref:Glucanase n=1 Tax=Pseudallescheria apiosperma TaxID=563466 RepID=A0A084GFC7_PSEDA|nr:Cellulose 1,4-beta-cellobiosidase (non-reducing end) [Scedosporium apiospermum]KEZ46039.1 Cellulose 1,4-beta-cellobiosidase (non-reducing end) [Scedosporium apiospermum]
MKFATTLGLFASLVAAQQVGKEQTETHPKMSWKKCTAPGSCTTVNAEVVIDANWRWLHTTDGYDNCYDGNEWVESVCKTGTECAEKCAIEGADYGTTYGASTSGDALTLKFLTKHEYGTNIGSRFYLMNGADKFQMFDLMDHEFTFDVDLSTLECGLNGALYFVAMEEDGGMASYSTNKAGAKYGTGYCDAQCARDLKFVGGKGNVEGWKPSSNDANAGVGPYGACCAEIDVWESNAHAFALTPHPCKDNNYHVCENDTCGGTYSEERFNGLCDANGCDYNPYRMGNPDFYGIGKVVDTSKKFTVVTRFEENKMSQFFVQDGKKIEIPAPTFEGLPDSSAITPEFCDKVFEVFDDFNRFNDVGGWPLLNDALRIPMVLVMSIWDDHYANMLWLDSTYPPEREGTPGAARGPCAQDSGVPSDVEANHPDAQVIWSNIRYGPIGSTVE